MHLADFALERYFARWEFSVRYVLGASDAQTMAMRDLLALADAETRSLWERLELGYTESPGLPLLREEIARLYDTVHADEVLTFTGAEEAIFLLMHALLQPGDHAIVISPAYQSLHEVARAIGAEVTAAPLDATNGWAFPLNLVRRSITSRTRVVVANFPHNPTGAMIGAEELDELLRICDTAGVPLFSDEVYRLMEHDPRDRLPAAVDRPQRAISLGVMSKAFGLAGLRVGWVATHDAALLRRLGALKDYTTICSSAPSEVLALIALRARETILARVRAIIDENLGVLGEFFARNEDRVGWIPPRAGTTAFPFFRDLDADEFAASLVRERGVLILPGSLFDFDPRYFRIGYGRTSMPAALALLEEQLSAARR